MFEKIEAVSDIAHKEVGYKETPRNTNKTKYGKWFGLDGLPWCGIFVSWVFHKAGTPLPKIGFEKGFASCQLAVDHYSKKNKIIVDPFRGCLVFYDWNVDGRFDHVGIVTYVGANTIETIEGNTSFKSDRNGGSVMLRIRNKSNTQIFVNPY